MRRGKFRMQNPKKTAKGAELILSTAASCLIALFDLV